MPRKLSPAKAPKVLGISGNNVHNGQIQADEFLPALRGRNAIRKYREMRNNDSTIGAVMYANEQILRDVEFKVVAANDTPEAQAEREFVESVLEDMEHSLEDHISEALSCLTYGFSWFEVVYKRRLGPDYRSPEKRSKHKDGRLGVRKIASRAPWTVNKFDIDPKTGDVLGLYQQASYFGKDNYIPINKSLYYKVPTVNNDPSGRSVLRNAYVPYEYLNNLQNIEAIAVERELNGIPVAYIPADYLSTDATADQVSVRQALETVLRDVKFNDQGYIILPSDMQADSDGKLSNHKMVDVRLMASEGKRNIDIDPIVKRYQHDIARGLMAEFLLLGAHGGGSYALSKSKTDLFLRALESYVGMIASVLNKQLVERLWELNGLNYDLMPKIVAGDVAPHDLREIAAFMRNINGADIDLTNQTELVETLLDIAELPFDGDKYEAKNVQQVPDQQAPDGVLQEPDS